MGGQQWGMKCLAHQVTYIPIEEDITINMGDAVIVRELRQLVGEKPNKSADIAWPESMASLRKQPRNVHYAKTVLQQAFSNTHIGITCADM